MSDRIQEIRKRYTPNNPNYREIGLCTRKDIVYLLDLIESLQREVDRLKQENKAMEDNIFVVCGVENVKEYSPVTICGIPIVDAIRIVKLHKNDQLQRERQEPKVLTLDELLEMDGQPIWTITIGVEMSGRYELCTGHTVCVCPLRRVLRCVTADGEVTDYELGTYGKTWLAYATEPKGDAKT